MVSPTDTGRLSLGTGKGLLFLFLGGGSLLKILSEGNDVISLQSEIELQKLAA